MQKRILIYSNIVALCILTSCVTPAQRDAMQKDISYLDQELDRLRRHLNVQTRQTEQNLKTSLSSQSDVAQLQSEIAENSGEIDSLKMHIKKLEAISSETSERYRTSLNIHEKEIESLNRKVAFLDAKNPTIEKKVFPAEKIKNSFKPKNANDVNKTLKRDYEKGWFKTVILKSSMVIQSSQSKIDMIESALEFRGEAKYKLADYSGAIVDLTNYIENYPKGTKRPRAFLLLGDAYVFLKQNTAAKYYYIECAEKYAKSSEAKACAARIQKL